MVSSVDGKVVAIERVMEDEFLRREAMMLSVFMSPLNVHANWFPVDGTGGIRAPSQRPVPLGISAAEGEQ